jgi:hypothetical protein
MDTSKREKLKKFYARHLEQVKGERASYAYRKGLPTFSDDSLREYLSIAIDGADQGTFMLPHFVETNKDDESINNNYYYFDMTAYNYV